MISFSRSRAKLAFRLMVFVSLVLPTAAGAQLRARSVADRVVVSEAFNLYLESDGTQDVIGFYVNVPLDWRIEGITHFDEERKIQFVDVIPANEADPRFHVQLRTPIEEGHVVVLRVVPPAEEGDARISTTPIILKDGFVNAREDLLSTTDVQVIRPLSRSSNHSAMFGGRRRDDGSISLRQYPFLSPILDYTSSFWIKTSGLNEIVLSSWSGSEEDSYPLELIVDPQGYLEFYQGLDSQHYSMRSADRVADGSWHFAVVTNNAETGWIHLTIDGLRADSLYHSLLTSERSSGELGLGQRPGTGAIMSGMSFFTGQLDEIRLLPYSQSIGEIRSEQKRPSKLSTGGGLLLDFESTGVRYSPSFTVRPSDLVFRHPPTDLGLEEEEDGIRLTFFSDDLDAEEFVVERSGDARQYLEVARIQSSRESGELQYQYVDYSELSGVVFYRIIPIYEDGPGSASKALKAGLGDSVPEHSSSLVGNFPNPFNPTTTITFKVELAQYIRITVWDLSGQMITTLVDGTQSPGEFDVSFNADSYPSGTYFVRMESNSGIQTHQMMLMK